MRGQLEVNLNGIGTWKGRNIIAGLAIVHGEWDPLLSWPCKLQADILLRDQPDDINEVTKNVHNFNGFTTSLYSNCRQKTL